MSSTLAPPAGTPEAEQPPRPPRDRGSRIRRRLGYITAALEHSFPLLPTHPEGTPEARTTEWLLDNAHLLAEALEQLRTGLRPGFLRRLPVLDAGAFEGEPRVYAIARRLVAEEGGRFDADRARHLLAEYQRTTPLTMAELWALPLMLRLVLLEDLAAIASRIAAAAGGDPPRRHGLWTEPPPVPHPDAVGSYVHGLRGIAATHWESFFEATSRVHGILSGDPGGVYPRMDFETRDRYRKAVERVARWGREDEEGVAAAAVGLSERHPPGAERERHVGYHLIDAGRPLLERELAIRPPLLIRLRRGAARVGLALYLGAILALTAVLLGILLLPLLGETSGRMVALALLVGLIPGHSLAVELVNWAATHLVRPRTLPKLDLEHGLPAEAPTAVVFPVLIAGERDIDDLLQQLELNYLGNPHAGLLYCLLVDFQDAPEREMPADAPLLATLQAGVHRLNADYAPDDPFLYLLYRDRRWNAREGRWMGRERKRGKLEEFNRLALGRPSELRVLIGDEDRLHDLRFAITLDADTLLPQGAALRLVATLAHPLNRAVFDTRSRVVAGYTVLQPRIEIRPTAAALSAFARIFQNDRGLDLYTRAVSDVYQDLFGEGSYAGKGIYDIAAFDRSLSGAVPENRVLSHDLFEGSHGRAGLVSDVVVFESYPAHVLEYMRRVHRWVRGDWQIAAWLLLRVPDAAGRRRNRLSALARWKILDNLRRSLLAAALLLLLLVGWLALPGPLWWWTVAALGPLAAPVVLSAASAVAPRRLGRRGVVRLEPPRAIVTGLTRWLLTVTLLPYRAWTELDAAARALIRTTITRRNLLEWTSAAHAGSRIRGEDGPRYVAAQMAPAIAFTLLALLAVVALRPAALPWAVPFLLLWLVSPLVAYRVSRPPLRRIAPLDPAHVPELRRIARRTWGFFEAFVQPEEQWLPPDNFQEDPHGVLARRTSPTNIGFLALSTLTAWDLGFLSLSGLTARLSNTLTTLERLERYRGHFLNWYETHSLAPLEPRYVSTVDSGNLAGALLAVAAGARDAERHPLPRSGAAGLCATLEELQGAVGEVGLATTWGDERVREEITQMLEALSAAGADAGAFARFVVDLDTRRLGHLEDELVQAMERRGRQLRPGSLAVLRAWLARTRLHVGALREELESLQPWLCWPPPPPALREILGPRWAATPPPGTGAAGVAPSADGAGGDGPGAPPGASSLAGIGEICRHFDEELARAGSALNGRALRSADALGWITTARAGLQNASTRVERLRDDLKAIAAVAERMADEMEFDFLYDPQRHLFHIGYNATTGRLDPSYYDLLASEARLASLFAIAKGDVPARHWVHLGRPFRRSEGLPALLAWGGSMFEFQLPGTLTRTPERSLLEMAGRTAVRLHRRFGRRYGIPWGISESAYFELDAHGTYQYRAFGVPGVALRRDAGERLVVTPYASALALEVEPAAVVRNFNHLAGLGGVGPFGFYESIDFGPAARGARHVPRIVRTYMAHHQGMILVAIGNLLTGGTMRTRFHADPRIAAVELLLHEHIPGHANEEPRLPVAALQRPRPPLPRPVLPRLPVVVRTWPQLQVLSNGHLSSLLTARGGGGLRWHDRALTPWGADPAREPHGLWIYLRDLDTDALWSATDAPTYAVADRQDIAFGLDAVEFRRWQGGIRTTLSVTVPRETPVEIRRLAIANETDRARRLRVTSYGEVALASPGEYRRHPAFAKLFVESRMVTDAAVLLFHRRGEDPEEETLWLAHGARTDAGATLVEHAVDRGEFLGRGRTIRAPRALRTEPETGREAPATTLDPLFSLTYEMELPPGGEIEIDFLTAAADSSAEALAYIEAFRTRGRVDWAFEGARLRCEREVRELQLAESQTALLGELLSAAVYPFRGEPHARAPEGSPAIAAPLRDTLWSLGISGDLPLIVFRATEPEEARTLMPALARMHAYWRRAGVRMDLVVLDEQAGDYAEPLRHDLHEILLQTGGLHWLNRSGGVFYLPGGRVDPAGRAALLAAASLRIDSDGGTLAEQLAATRVRPPPLPPFVPIPSTPPESLPTEPIPRAEGLLFETGFGGFDAETGEYVIRPEPGRSTPAPWSNVVANPEFGFLATERGLGFTWSRNSGEYRLTPWVNDPVTDPPGEVLYLRDEETAATWTPTPAPAPADAPYEVRHGTGHTTFRHASHGLTQELLVSIAPDEPIKIVRVRLSNQWPRQRRLTLTYYAEWVLGTDRRVSSPYLTTEFDEHLQAILARQTFSPEFAGRVAFLAASEPAHGATGDRIEFFGATDSIREPEALRRIGLSGSFGAHLDPCGVLQLHLDLEPGDERTIYFLLGDGADREEAVRRIQRFRDPAVSEDAIAAERTGWDDHLDRVQVRTPEPALDLMVNRWLPYQALSCRVWGRSGFYQSSGAYGFRDQLQDVTSLFLSAPGLARTQILEAARHQFTEGDVLHWWHPHTGAGVRTRCSDDLLWLPFVTAAYIEATGDAAILDEPVPFLTGEPLGKDELERYTHFPPGATASLLEHCLRAVERGSTRGAHGLPLIGTGDWNDAMNRIGIEGRGESVWLAWFLHLTLGKIAGICEVRGHLERARELRARAQRYAAAAEEEAWDGAWYRRAYFDDGTPVGSAESRECRIDSLTQSWAVLSGGADPERARRALAAARAELVSDAARLVLLLTPPFDRSLPAPGYIRAYPPGVRENGGQYTHAAIWMAWAFAELGDGDEAGRLLHLLLPPLRTADESDVLLYRVEPYVVAADIYGVPPHTGRGGWTWYTGSAGWLYRLAVEAVLGIRLREGRLTIDPCIPARWEGFEATIRIGAATFRIVVRNPDGVSTGVTALELDGRPLESNVLPRVDGGGDHEVVVLLGGGALAGRAGERRAG